MNKKDFANFVKDKRRELNMTQEELADKLFVSRNVVAKWENGTRYPDMEMSQKLAEILHVTPNEMYEQSSVNDNKHSIDPAFIIAPIIILIAIAGFIIVPLSLRDNVIGVAGKVDNDKGKDKIIEFKIKNNSIIADEDNDYNGELKITYKSENGPSYEVTNTATKNDIVSQLSYLNGGVVDNKYNSSDYYFEITYSKSLQKNDDISKVRINKTDNTVAFVTVDGQTVTVKYDENTIESLITLLWNDRAANWASDEELRELYKEYPWNFNITQNSVTSGITLLVWKNNDGNVSCTLNAGKISATDTTLLDSIIFNNGISVEEMKKIMTSYRRDVKFLVEPIVIPNSGYERTDEYVKELKQLFDDVLVK